MKTEFYTANNKTRFTPQSARVNGVKGYIWNVHESKPYCWVQNNAFFAPARTTKKQLLVRHSADF